MLDTVRSYINDFAHFFFPHNCLGCGSDVLDQEHLICSACFFKLPLTNFFNVRGNALEKKFYGRVACAHAASSFYFSKHTIIQKLIFELKYRGNKGAGIFLGKLMGSHLLESDWSDEIDVIVPLPLHERKQKLRGYNQSEMIASGLSDVIKKPVEDKTVKRTIFTDTQTRKDRISRWQNMEEAFNIINSEKLRGKHVLLVDDVVTTGATLEACGQAILDVPQTRLSIATIALA